MSDKTTQDVRMENIESALRRIENKVEDGFDKLNGRVRTNEVEIAGIKGRASTAGVVSGVLSGAVAGFGAWFGFGR